MSKCVALLLLAIYATSPLFAQDNIINRVILIGDAGETVLEQRSVIDHAASQIIKAKTTVLFLGDNIYPRGMGLPGDSDEQETKDILDSQYKPMRAAGAPVYFIPGNHDWDRMGPRGLAKIKRQWQYLEERQDSLLKLVPPNGCPDPVEINVSDSLTIIAFDSEWWVFPHAKENPEAECNCTTKDDVIAQLEELAYKNREKVVLLAFHHPFQSYGVHGGYYSLKDHLFPLTAVSKKLYIPLPLLGSLYPLLRSVFTNPEDMGHPLYKNMISRVSGVFDHFENIVYVSGHDHGLQLIRNKDLQVVSGAGAKNSHAKKGKHALFASSEQGYVVADFLKGNSLKFTYFQHTQQGVRAVFTYTKPYIPVASASESRAAVGTDSIAVRIRPSYDSVGKFHRKLFGENYRKEWAALTKLPVIRISEIHGGLTPVKRGGGMQSKSLRLVDASGKEWVIRSVEKSPDMLLPEELRGTFARDWLDDAMSAQHPFAALVIPPLAQAAGVPYANPVIGIIAPDDNLGIYSKAFANTVCLLEEREPLGESDNTPKMIEKVTEDNDNSFDGETFLKARMLDLLVGDWDRHEDQWRWQEDTISKDKFYTSVPRDRDQALYLNEGFLPRIASRSWVLPTLQGFDGEVRDVRYSLFKSRFLNAHPALQMQRGRWNELTREFTAALTDSVLEDALRRLPPEIYGLKHESLLAKLKDRRDQLPEEMDKYYKFIHEVVDIRHSDKHESVRIEEDGNRGLRVTSRKINKDGELKDTLTSTSFHPDITREIRVYLGKGNDSIVVNPGDSPIKLRLIGGAGKKYYKANGGTGEVLVYDKVTDATFTGDTKLFRKHLSDDSVNTAFVPVNLYNVTMPLVTAGLNRDDGLLLGAGFRYTGQKGFRKVPFTTRQQLDFSHSFSTEAFRIRYFGEWTNVLVGADLTLRAQINAPNNTMNFFGRGNNTELNKTGDYKTFYRTRFNTFLLNPALRWNNAGGASFSVGPALQYYSYDPADNQGRFISSRSGIGSYDSLTVNKEKVHAGLTFEYVIDKRNNRVMPSWGSYVSVKAGGYKGVNSFSESYAQLLPEVAVYKSLNARATIVLAERLGGTVTLGKTAFYQSAFLGGQGNLMGFRQYRFAGQHAFYNNLELRIKLANFASYILPGQFGLTGFYDTGRVWEKGMNGGGWHHGVGGGIYFAPAGMTVVQVQAGYSREGWYPGITLGFRY